MITLLIVMAAGCSLYFVLKPPHPQGAVEAEPVAYAAALPEAHLSELPPALARE
ncbi:hypothetical protein [Paenibacillus mucilaginosus]|uniref:Uncharacterized protein n=2 Tax=Paenibacillus mucilaginosus TaxID=61624 RepID=H6NA41_9BACL|nr:hypothetical protein [Paenibacillus mucilaginosus]AEI40241.1 hypothetical protein KNP414_01678 [Paenibacillus mucilaginosus KNP414]AFC28885.1 hypothetical protein PM3016_1983 [Paenibacillus mucilaginosus 3016]MCG7213390.1 hypothetical protein [Paenibacillus mucilaginosus]WDM29462.1 hypothetical protein KCX80_10025 [Paenibacillus mucilaginosus]